MLTDSEKVEQEGLFPSPEAPIKPQPGWAWCKTCGAGYAETPEAKGLCHECRRLKTFLKPVLDVLGRIEAALAGGKG